MVKRKILKGPGFPMLFSIIGRLEKDKLARKQTNSIILLSIVIFSCLCKGAIQVICVKFWSLFGHTPPPVCQCVLFPNTPPSLNMC